MSRKTDAETLADLEARKKELDEKIKKKKAALKEKIRAEEARKKDAEKRKLEHIKFILGGILLNNYINTVMESTNRFISQKGDNNKITEYEAIKIIDNYMDKRILAYGHIGEIDCNSLRSIVLMKIKNTYEVISSDEKSVVLETVSCSGDDAVSPPHEE